MATARKNDDMSEFKNFKLALIVGLLMPILFSCSTYNTKLSKYYSAVKTNNYAGALTVLNKNRFINEPRNVLLSYFEKGRMCHLLQQYDSSNLYFNLADKFIEDNHKTLGDVVVSNIVNPMVQTYLGEDFECLLIHYYKALNYYYLGKPEDAIVEARRITLSTNKQKDKFKDKSTRYSKDAFLFNLQGMLYEMNGDMNNAFIAYRNAVEVYQAASNNYYGVSMPQQLKVDVINAAIATGFTDEANNYKNTFTMNNLPAKQGSVGELVVFIEQGWGPEKKQQDLFLTKDASGLSTFYYVDELGQNVQVPFDIHYYHSIRSEDVNWSSFRTFHIAFPSYIPFSNNYSIDTVEVNKTTYTTQLSEDVNSIAINVLKERKLKEITNAIARQIVKHLVEKGVEKGVVEAAKESSSSKDDNKKNKDADLAGNVAGLLVNLVNSATEKADTRCWQSLPAFINYVRVPLKEGSNSIVITANGIKRTINIDGRKGLQFYNWSVGR